MLRDIIVRVQNQRADTDKIIVVRFFRKRVNDKTVLKHSGRVRILKANRIGYLIPRLAAIPLVHPVVFVKFHQRSQFKVDVINGKPG
jgi:hypothetical protein